MPRRIALLAAAAFLGCTSDVAPQNPFDREAPPSVQSKARVEGLVTLEAAASYAGTQVTLTEAASSAGAPLSSSVVTTADGAFVVEVAPGTYNLLIQRPDYEEISLPGLALQAGERRSVGIVALPKARGAIGGQVVLDDNASPSGTAVSLIPLEAGAPLITVLAGPDGSWFADRIAAGDYALRAEKESYAPAYTAPASSLWSDHDQGLHIGQNKTVQAPTLRLYPASAIVQAKVAGQINAPWTRERAIEVQLLAFVQFLTDMRVSEDTDFADTDWDVDYRQFSAQTGFILADRDGPHRICGQFKDSFSLESSLFCTAVTLDRARPEITRLEINGGASYLTADDGAGAASLSFAGQDLLSGVDAYRYTLADQFSDEPLVQVDSVGPSFSLAVQVALGDANGEKVVRSQIRDRAGNLSLVREARIVRDKTPPRLGTPVLSLAEAGTDGAVHSLDVTLIFDVEGDRTDERLMMAVANAPGLDAGAFFVPFQSPYPWRLAAGPDSLLRTVCAAFKDQAGLTTTERCIPVRVDRTGRVSGQVLLEGEPLHSGALIEVFDGSGAVYTDLSGGEGGFEVGGIPGGLVYTLRATRDGFDPAIVRGLVVPAGGTLALEAPLRLVHARGAIAGKATLQGETSHEGIFVEVVGAAGLSGVTDRAGDFLIPSVPVGATTLRAEKGAAYFSTLSATVQVLANRTTTLAPDMVLAPVPGRIFGSAARQGLANRAGILALVRGFSLGGTVLSDNDASNTDGAFEIAQLPAGTYTAELVADGFKAVKIDSLFLEPGGVLDLGHIVLSPATGEVTGSVELVGQTRYGGVRVALSVNNVERAFTYSDTSGSYRLQQVPAGTYTLAASLAGYGTQRRSPIIVNADQPTPVAKVSLFPQVGEVAIEGVITATNRTTVRIVGSYPDAVAARFCEDPAVDDPDDFPLAACGWSALTTTGEAFDPVPVTFKATACPDPGDQTTEICDGAKTFWVKFQDASSAESAWLSAPVILDRRPPAGHIVIEPLESTLSGGAVVNGGAPYTRDLSVSALVVAADDRSGVASGGAVSGVSMARLYRGAADPNPLVVALDEEPLTLYGLLLSGGADGPRTFILKLSDAAGNDSVTDLAAVACPFARSNAAPTDCDRIFYDSTPIQSLRFSVNPVDVDGDYAVGSAYATSPLVQLGIDSTSEGLAEQEAVEAVIANDVNFTASMVQPLPAPRAILNWFLSTGEGSKTVALKVRDRAGNLSGPFYYPIILDTVPPDAPGLTAVGATTSQRRPRLSFGAVAGADRYRVQLSGTATFSALLADVTGAATFHDQTSDLSDGPYWWRAKALDAAGHESPFSAADSFVVDTLPPAAPVLLAVPSPTSSRTPELRWGPVPGAATYAVEIDTSTDFNTASRIAAAGIPGASFTAPILADGPWHARVRAVDLAANSSPFSAPVSFTVDTLEPENAVLSAPAANALLANPSVTFGWDPVDGAASYRLQVGPAGTWPADHVEHSVTGGTQKTLSMDDGGWTFRVGTVDAAGNLSNISAAPTRTLTVDTAPPATPTLALLPTLIATRTPTFAWSSEAASGATGYVLKVDSRTYPTANLTATPTDALSDGPHTWTVAAKDAATNQSLFAAAQAFTVDATAPAAPVVTAVAPDPTPSAQPAFAWSTVADAASYFVQWDTTSGFTTALSRTVIATATQPTLPLTAGTWYWRVLAVDLAGNRSAPSGYDVFAVDLTAPIGPSVTILEGDSRSENGFTNKALVTLRLTAGASPASVVVAENPALSGGATVSMTGTTVSTTFTLGGTGLRTVWARFYDAAGNQSDLAVATVTLDQTKPSRAPATLSPSRYATSTSVELIPPAAGQDELQVTGGVTAPTGFVSAPAGVPIAVTLNGATQGSKTLTITYRDLADNTDSPPALTIILDSAIPTGCALALAGTRTDGSTAPAEKTASPNVAASVGSCSESMTDGSIFLTSAQSVVCSSTSALDWQPFRSPLPFILPGPDGQNSVRGCVRDAAGNVGSLTADTIELDTIAPTAASVVLDSGATYSRSATFTASALGSATGAAEWALSDAATSLTSFYTTNPRNIAFGGNGQRTAYALFRDDVYNYSAVAADSILFDSTPPATDGASVAIVSPTANTFTNSVSATLLLTAPADATQVILGSAANPSSGCVDGDTNGRIPQPVAGTISFLLKAGDELKRVCAKLYDAAGNVSTSFISGTITLDTVLPSAPNILTKGRTINQADGSTVVVQTYGSITELNFQRYQRLGGKDVTWTDDSTDINASSFKYRLVASDSDTDGIPNLLRLRAVDKAGNASPEATVVITTDTVKPAKVTLDTRWVTNQDGQATIYWKPGASPDVAGHKIYYGSSSGARNGQGSALGASPVTAGNVTSFTLSGLQNGAPSYITVHPFDFAGNEGDDSATSEVLAQPNEVSPSLIAALQLSMSGIRKMALYGNHLYVLGQSGGCGGTTKLQALDISTLVSPVQGGTIVDNPGGPVLTFADTSTDGLNNCDAVNYGMDMIADGNYLYVTAGTRLRIYSLAVPASPAVVAALDFNPLIAQGMAIDGSTIFVTFQGGTIHALSIADLFDTNSASTVTVADLLGTVTNGTAKPSGLTWSHDRILQSHYSTVGSAFNVTYLFDASAATVWSNADNQGSLSVLSGAATSTGQLASGNYLYWASYSGNSFQVYKLNTAWAGGVVGSSDFVGGIGAKSSGQYEIHGGQVFANDAGAFGVRALDVNDAAAIRDAGLTRKTVGNPSASVVYGNYLFNGDLSGRLEVYEIASPRFLHTVTSATGYAGMRSEVHGRFLYSTGGMVHDLQGGWPPPAMHASATSLCSYDGARFDDSMIVSASYGTVLRVLDLEKATDGDGTPFTQAANSYDVTLTAPTRAQGLAAVGNYLVAAEQRSDGTYVEVFNAEKVRDHQTATSFSLADSEGSLKVTSETGVADLSVADGRAFLTLDGTSDGLFVVDVRPLMNDNSDLLTASHLQGYVPTQGVPRESVARGNYAYVATAWGLEIIDITKAMDENLATTLSGGDWKTYLSLPQASGLDVHGSYAVVVPASPSAVHVVDISNPLAPVVVGSLPYAGTGGSCGSAGQTISFQAGVTVRGSRAYVTGFNSLEIIELE